MALKSTESGWTMAGLVPRRLELVPKDMVHQGLSRSRGDYQDHLAALYGKAARQPCVKSSSVKWPVVILNAILWMRMDWFTYR